MVRFAAPPPPARAGRVDSWWWCQPTDGGDEPEAKPEANPAAVLDSLPKSEFVLDQWKKTCVAPLARARPRSARV